MSNTESGYNGYTNYQTWAVSLWIDNDQYLQEMFADSARKAESVSDLSDEIKAYIDEMQEETGTQVTGMFADLLTHAIGSVNWYEIAENFYQEYHEDEQDDDSETEE